MLAPTEPRPRYEFSSSLTIANNNSLQATTGYNSSQLSPAGGHHTLCLPVVNQRQKASINLTRLNTTITARHDYTDLSLHALSRPVTVYQLSHMAELLNSSYRRQRQRTWYRTDKAKELTREITMIVINWLTCSINMWVLQVVSDERETIGLFLLRRSVIAHYNFFLICVNQPHNGW